MSHKQLSPCDNQDDFNVAFRNALKYNEKENMKKARPYMYVYLVLWLVVTVWALLLAMQVPAGNSRVLHVFFALVASPMYVLSFYLGNTQKENYVGMGYGHRR